MNRRSAMKRMLAGGSSVLVLNDHLISHSLSAFDAQAILTFDLNDPRFAELRNIDGYLSVGNALAPGIESSLQANYPLAVVRNSVTQISAMEHFCTHQGCHIGAYDSALKRFQCSCHGSRFSGTGAILRGPAMLPLNRYPATLGNTLVTISNLPGSANWNLTSVESPTSATAFELRQNYPNPFNPSTRITYILATRTHINLTVYDALGRSVVILVDTVQDAGMHIIDFNASGLSSGEYFYTLRAGAYTESKHMILMK